MAAIQSLFTKLISIFLLIYFDCFSLPPTNHHGRRHNLRSNRHKTASSPFKLKTHKALSTSWSFLKRILTSKPDRTAQTHPDVTTRSEFSTRSSQQPSIVSMIPPDNKLPDPPIKRPAGFHLESNISADQHFFPLRNDIYPCPGCGEIFQKPGLLEQHQSTKHAVSELIDGDSGSNIVRIIFNTGWPGKAHSPNISRILKIHNSPNTLAHFEDYRENVKSKVSRNGAVRRRDERCIADGNELLRFHCSTFLCDLGQNGNSTICNHQYCSVCGIIRSGFSSKMDGISTLSSSWRAHVVIPDEVEEEFKFMNVRRAMLVCRVIAGRVGSDQEMVDKEDPGYESVAGRGGEVHGRLDDADELLVFNPRAVLPCFVIVYTV